MTIEELLYDGVEPAAIPVLLNPTGDKDEAAGIRIEIEIELGDIGDNRDPTLLEERGETESVFAGLTMTDFYPEEV
jgi:hypothetical protein